MDTSYRVIYRGIANVLGDIYCVPRGIFSQVDGEDWIEARSIAEAARRIVDHESNADMKERYGGLDVQIKCTRHNNAPASGDMLVPKILSELEWKHSVIRKYAKGFERACYV